MPQGVRHIKAKNKQNYGMGKRNRYTADFKSNVVLELLREELTLNEVAAKYQLNPQMINQWHNAGGEIDEY